MAQLLPEERTQLHVALKTALQTDGELELLVAHALGLNINEVRSSDDVHSTAILKIIQRAEAAGAVEQLINTARQLNSHDQTLEQYGNKILARLARMAAAAWYQPDDPYRALFIAEAEDGPAAFISRKKLRTFFENLDDPMRSRVLTVNGISKSGKSYSLQFITYLSQKLQPASYRVAWVDLQKQLSFTPEEVVRSIARQVGWPVDEIPEQQPTAARYAKVLCEWLQGEAAAEERPVVIVLDDFHEPELNTETRELISEMIIRASAKLANIRLVLLNYSQALLPPSLQAPVGDEQLGQLTESELREFFGELHKQMKGQPAVTRVITRIVRDVFQHARDDKEPWNKALNKWATKAALKLR